MRAIRVPLGALALASALILVVAVRMGAPPEDPLRPASSEEPRLWGAHNPPLLVLPDEAVELEYDLVCTQPRPAAESCEREGTVYLRAAGEAAYEPIPLVEGGADLEARLHAPVPPRFLEAGRFHYYAELRSGEQTVVLPPGGADVPHRAWVLDDATAVALGAQSFDLTAAPDGTVLAGPWGPGTGELGLESGEERSTIGPSSFDVAPDGTVVVADQNNGRLVRVDPAGGVATVPVDVRSSLPDIAAGDGGTVYVLESSAPDGGTPLVKEFDTSGTLVSTSRIAEGIPSKIRLGTDGPVVLQYPSGMWMPPLDLLGDPLEAVEQLTRSTLGLIGPDGVGALVKALPTEIRVALTDGEAILASWRVSRPALPADVRFGEVQLAEPYGDGGALLVAAVWTEEANAFRVLHLGPTGAVGKLTVDAGDWAEAASVSRFRLGPDGALYQLRSFTHGADVVRFDIEG